MELVREVTARLENKPGRLAKICSALAHEKVNIQALSVMDTAERSVLRLVTDQAEATRRILTSLGTESELSEVLAVEMENKPGALARLLERLAEEHINVEYAYSAHDARGRATGILHTDNVKRAMQVLGEPAGSNGAAQPGRRPLHSR